ncbi:MAG: hypothetical protein ABSG41_25005 [Bryobacteraceae bacterium]
MKIVIERHACSTMLSGELRNVFVLGVTEADVRHVDRFPSFEPE